MNKNALKEAGLSEYEADIYLSLLRYPQISAYELAKKVGLYRQVTYDSLNRLIEKGFVTSITEGKNSLYKAVDPKIILEYLKEKTESFEKTLPDLIKIQNVSKDPLSVETYRGKNVVRIALRDIVNTLKSGGEVLCTAVDESLPFSQHKTILAQYERDIVRYKIKERVILQEGRKGIFKKGNSSYRKIPERFFNPNPLQIYGDNVQIIVFGHPDYLIIIRNKGVADSYRKQFELLWSTAKK